MTEYEKSLLKAINNKYENREKFEFIRQDLQFIKALEELKETEIEVPYIKEVLGENKDDNMSKKIIQIEINDNSNLTDEELKDRGMLLAVKYMQATQSDDLNTALKYLTEIIDMGNIKESRKNKEVENEILE